MHTFFPSCGSARVRIFCFHEDHMTSSQTSNPVLPPPSKRAHTESYPDGNPDAPYNPPGLRNTDSCLPLRRTGEVAHNYTGDGPAPGDIAFRWIHGSVSSTTNSDPRIHVVAYNEDTYILRENPC